MSKQNISLLFTWAPTPSPAVNSHCAMTINELKQPGLSKCQLCPNVSNQNEVIPQSCYNISLDSAKSRNETGGVFDIDIPTVGKTEVYCDVTTDGGNWIVSCELSVILDYFQGETYL